MQKPIEKDIVVDGQLVHYYQVETRIQKKNTLIFLHGWGSNSTLWFSSTLTLAEQGYELIFLDLPGFGKSQTPKKPFHVEDYAHIVSLFVQKLGIEQPVLIGHSFGGKTAVRITSKKMIPISGLILVDASGLPHTSFITQAKIRVAKTVSPLFRIPILKELRTGLLRLSGSDDYVAFPELRETFITIIQEHIQGELSQINVPTLIVWGRDDKNSYTPLTDASVFQQAIPHAKMIIIDKAGHYVFLDQSHHFNDALSSFIESLHAHH